MCLEMMKMRMKEVGVPLIKQHRWLCILSSAQESLCFRTRPHYADEIWKLRSFHSENASNVFQLFLSTLRRRNLKTAFSLRKRSKCFPSTLRRINLKGQQSAFILDFCLTKSRSGKSHSHREVISSKSAVFKMFPQSWCFQIPPVWTAFSKSSVFGSD